jgi:2-succinyl-5-enolpyruvyl-6-hydroxy-3-cyclohexene-1-carboxylate synthase
MPLLVAANRGVSGIDGNVSTAAGMAAAGRPTVALVGDLALWHDMNGLLAARGLPLVVVVIDNGGGGIFEYLPQAGLPGFERYWLTPTGVSLEGVAALYGMPFTRVDDAAGAAAAVAGGLAQGGGALVAVTVDRRESVRRHRAWWQAVAAALG